ncbi:MAG TPA: FHA domain-containing protein [Luteolibacter sp.]|nr:FHA domain-containing protein [Luteolibacter sp.]
MPRITITAPGQVPQPYRLSLDRQVVHFGRAADNDIVINCPSVSSEHAAMERTIGGYVLNDLGSTNGIKLNGEKVSKIQLRNGQSIRLGDVDFCFQLTEEELQILIKEDPTSRLPPMPADEKSTPKPTEQKPAELPPAPSSSESKPATQTSAPSSKAFDDDDFIDLDAVELEVAPKQRRRSSSAETTSAGPAPRPKPQALPKPSGGYGLLFLLAILAFIVGVAMHFQRATGKSVIQVIEERINGPIHPAPGP